jgi:chorismate mutase
MPKSLTQSRQELLDNYLSLINLIQSRSSLVEYIQSQKMITNTQYPHFDFEREWVLFSKLSTELKKLCLGELLAISILIETHAGAERNKYPAWSKSIHLHDKSLEYDLHQLINPIMIFNFDQKIFKRLRLKTDFKLLFERTTDETGCS